MLLKSFCISRYRGSCVTSLKNFRPVSNLSFISELLEKIAQTRIQAFFDSNGLMPRMQSAYRRLHSTETAVSDEGV